MTRTITDQRPTSRNCRRCGGSGIYGSIGTCFRCGGGGREMEEYERPMTPEEIRREEEYAAALTRAAAQNVARKARIAARSR
jgi:ribosomal protein L37E